MYKSVEVCVSEYSKKLAGTFIMVYQMTVHPLKLSFPHAGPPSPYKGQETVSEKTMGVLLQVTRVPTLTQTISHRQSCIFLQEYPEEVLVIDNILRMVPS